MFQNWVEFKPGVVVVWVVGAGDVVVAYGDVVPKNQNVDKKFEVNRCYWSIIEEELPFLINVNENTYCLRKHHKMLDNVS